MHTAARNIMLPGKEAIHAWNGAGEHPVCRTRHYGTGWQLTFAPVSCKNCLRILERGHYLKANEERMVRSLSRYNPDHYTK